MTNNSFRNRDARCIPHRPSVTFRLFLLALILGFLGRGSAQSPPPNSVDALIRAIQVRDLILIKKILNSGLDLNAVSRDGTTLLEEATIHHLPDLAIEIIRRGADVNLRPGILLPPLIAAAEVCSEDVVRSLLEHGAKANAKDPEGDTALLVASAHCKDGRIVQILLKAGADPNASDDVGYTPLIAAAEGGNMRATEELIAAGADLNAVNSEGETALDVARDHPFRREAHERICVLLLKASRK